MSAGRHSYVPFYASDWIAGTARMTPMQELIYFRVCCYIWDKAEPVPDGEPGYITVTDLSNFAMPFIRYDVGDDIEFFPETEPCPCGRTLPLVKVIHGRSEDIIITPDGRLVTTMFVLPELMKGIRFVQFIQELPTVLHVNVVPGETWTEGESEKLSCYVKKLAGKEMDVRMHQITQNDIITDTSGKTRTVISYVKPQI